jgi:hypothetical protein
MRLFIISLLLFTACSPLASVPTPTNTPYNLQEPFLAAWQRAGGEAIGAPLSEPLWLDGWQTQLFADVRIVAADSARASVEPQPPDWQNQLPTQLLDLPAAPLRADIDLPPGVSNGAAPLTPISLTVTIADYAGPAELQLFDARLRPTGVFSFTVEQGHADLQVAPRGALGPQWALILVDGRLAGARSALYNLNAQTTLHSGHPEIDSLYPAIIDLMQGARVSYDLYGREVVGYRSPDNPLLWLRDHVYQGRGFRYVEADVTSVLDAFRVAQRADGSFPDVLDYPERFVTATRKEVEADLEYLFVQGVYEAWQMTGDEAILRRNLDAMRRGLRYLTSDPQRWDAARGLVRRPYTIDTWDFSYGPTTISPDGKPAPRHWIDEMTIWGTFHGDNTGLVQALRQMARVEELVGEAALAREWDALADAILDRLNNMSWNGRFYRHFIPEDPGFSPQGVDLDEQLSLSNALALNRGVFDERQGQKVVDEYYSRRDFDRAFAEWYSIDPPFPAGSYGMAGGKGENPGEYVNGGIMPLTGGELARGAFRYGREAYGFDILLRYAQLLELTGASYLWYYPDGRPGISGADTLATDGWGSSAMLGALIEGAAGIVDRGAQYEDAIISLRWEALPGVNEVYAVARYAAADGYSAYRWQRDEGGYRLELSSSGEKSFVRFLLPPDAPKEIAVILNGARVMSMDSWVGEKSRYLTLPVEGGSADINISW